MELERESEHESFSSVTDTGPAPADLDHQGHGGRSHRARGSRVRGARVLLCKPQFFYTNEWQAPDDSKNQETVAPLLLIGNTSLITISTLTREANFYTRLLRMRDKTTGMPLFTCLSIQLACKQCIEEGKAASCVHMLHLVPRWQSSDRHVKLKTIMQVGLFFFV